MSCTCRRSAVATHVTVDLRGKSAGLQVRSHPIGSHMSCGTLLDLLTAKDSLWFLSALWSRGAACFHNGLLSQHPQTCCHWCQYGRCIRPADGSPDASQLTRLVGNNQGHRGEQRPRQDVRVLHNTDGPRLHRPAGQDRLEEQHTCCGHVTLRYCCNLQRIQSFMQVLSIS